MYRALTAGVAVAAVLALVVLTAWAQHGGGAGGAGHGAHGGGMHTGPAPHRAVDACAAEFEKVVGEGRGFGMAFAADKHGYPGPMHALELAHQLALSPDQEARLRALEAAMFAESRPKSARLLEAERRLQQLFADGRADEASVRAAVEQVERARSDVRLVHLLTHLKTHGVLTEEQRAAYTEARWGRR